MSVTFYRTAWAFAHNAESLDKITSEELIHLAIKPNDPNEYERKPWLLEIRRERAGEIEQKYHNMLVLSASGSRGECLRIDRLAETHKDVLFISISGSDCMEEERVSLFKNGKLVQSCDGILKDTRFLAALRIHRHYISGKELCEKIENEYYELLSAIVGEDFQDAILQDDPEEQ